MTANFPVGSSLKLIVWIRAVKNATRDPRIQRFEFRAYPTLIIRHILCNGSPRSVLSSKQVNTGLSVIVCGR